jgi:hypothetical protein
MTGPDCMIDPTIVLFVHQAVSLRGVHVYKNRHRPRIDRARHRPPLVMPLGTFDNAGLLHPSRVPRQSGTANGRTTRSSS